MQFSVLGPVGVVVDGRRVSLGRGQERTILATLLAADGAVVGPDHLIDALWADAPPASARKSLQSHLSRLRRNLRELFGDDADWVRSTPEGYRILACDGDVDAHRFTTLTDRARQAQDPHAALDLFDAAHQCWHGPAYGDLAGHPALTGAAQHLERLRRTAVVERAQVLLTLGRHEELTGTLPALIAQDPYNEQAHAAFMQALVATGRRAEALTAFDDLRTRLRDELGVDPTPELRGLHQRILRQDALPASLQSSPQSPPTSRPQATPSTAPPADPSPITRRATPLLGRDRDLDELSAALPGASVLTLTGSGGVGKTSLAEHLVERTREVWRDGVMQCALAHIRDPEGVGGALITALSIQSVAGQSAEQSLVSGLGERHLLLFLDNCEHVLAALTPYVAAIVAGCPGVTVLATSRERLRLPSEQVWPVAPLDVPPVHATRQQVLNAPAGSLFYNRAQAVEPGFVLHDDNAPAVAEMCRRLDGMPLAIELAAARVRALSPQALVDRLDQRFAVLAGGPVHEGGRHRTLQAVVTWSYDLLAPAEADLFDRLAVFAGAVPLTAIEAVCADLPEAGLPATDMAEADLPPTDVAATDLPATDLPGVDLPPSGSPPMSLPPTHLPATDIAGLLGELVDKSMVVVQRGEHEVRYRMLETMRDFGTRRLAERGITEALRRAHAAHYLALAQAEGERARGADEADAVATLTAAMDDLRAAHAWALTQEDLNVALRLPGAIPEEVAFRLRDEVTTWARRALVLPGAGTHPARPHALTTSAWGGTSRDECGRAVAEATEVIETTESGSAVALSALRALATAALYEGRLADVLALISTDYGITDTRGSHFHRAFLWVCHVLAHLYRGDVHAATAGLPALHEAANSSGSPTMQAFAHYSQGEVLMEQDPERSAPALKQAVELGRMAGNRLVEGVALVCLASSQGRHGEPAEALAAYRDVVLHWRRAGDHTHQLTAVRNLVVLLAEIGAAQEAALLHGAVTSAGTPTFGVEKERLDGAWHQIKARLGGATAEVLAAQGQRLESRQVGDQALEVLTALLTESRPEPLGEPLGEPRPEQPRE